MAAVSPTLATIAAVFRSQDFASARASAAVAAQFSTRWARRSSLTGRLATIRRNCLRTLLMTLIPQTLIPPAPPKGTLPPLLGQAVTQVLQFPRRAKK
jgi:hypothetical protein